MTVDIAGIRLAADIRSHNFLNLLLRMDRISHTLRRSLKRVRKFARVKQAVRVATQYASAPPPAS